MMCIGGNRDYYDFITVKQEGDKFYWSIEDHSGRRWEEIPGYLYGALIKYEIEREKL